MNTISQSRSRLSWDFTRIQLILSLVGVVSLVIIAVFAPLISPFDPLKQFVSEGVLEPPSSRYLMGTDQVGRDILSRVISGTRISLAISLGVLAFGLVIGVSVGALAGFFGGWIEEIAMRITDIFLAFPYFVLAMALVATLGRGVTSVIIALGLVWWPAYARLVRGQVLSIRERTFVEAAKVIGNGPFGLLTKHILPQTLSELMVRVTLDIGNIILAVSGLSFLGLGARPPLAEWGAIIGEGRPYGLSAPWITVFPGVAIIYTILCFSLLGDALQSILQPGGSQR
jgi:peptide/nickel transport system permease protein